MRIQPDEHVTRKPVKGISRLKQVVLITVHPQIDDSLI